MQVEHRHGLDELRGLARAERDARMRIRVQAIVLAKQGRTAEEIAATLSVSRRPVQEWVRRYNESGVDGLRRRPGQGRREKLSVQQRERFVARIQAGAQSTDEVCTLRGRDFQRILKEEFGQLYRLSSVYALMHRLGYSCLMPRPQHPLSDPEAQEAFKKKSWRRSKRSAKRMPTSESKSGSRTKHGSGNRVR